MQKFGCLKLGNEKATNEDAVLSETFDISSRCGSIVIAYNITYLRCFITA